MEPKTREARTVGILIFDDVEVLDFCGPFEAFSVALQAGEDRAVAPLLFRAITIAQNARTVKCFGGLLVQPQATTGDHPPLDILVVPGGIGTRRERLNRPLLDWITAQNARTELTTSVCTGALLLAESGLLDGGRATTHWGAIDLMRGLYPRVEVVSDISFVDTGHIVTSAGISAGIEMSLHVIARLHGEATAAATARYMEYKTHLFAT